MPFFASAIACRRLASVIEIGGAELIVLAPASPVLHLVEHLIELFGVAREARGRGRARAAARSGAALLRGDDRGQDVALASAVPNRLIGRALVAAPISGRSVQRVISSAWMFPSLALPAAFFLSGAAGLIFQVVWLYRCGLVLGSSVAAVTVVLSGFMGGSRLATRWPPGSPLACSVLS